MWQTKYASAVPKCLGLGLNFRLCSEDYFWGPVVRAYKLLLFKRCCCRICKISQHHSLAAKYLCLKELCQNNKEFNALFILA